MGVVNDRSLPSYGDIVFVPDGFGTWVVGITNGWTLDGKLLIAVGKGAHTSGAPLVTADPDAHGLEWAWPTDMPEDAQAALRDAAGRVNMRFER